MTRSRFANYAWFVLAYNILVIVYGAFVRASFSGDGCGSHWPLCNGSLIPSFSDKKTLIEYTHRMMSALDGLLVLILLIWAVFKFGRTRVTKAAGITFLFIIFESLIGMGLVRFGWVAHDTSSERAVVLAVHLANTFILLGSLTLVWLWASGTNAPKIKGQGGLGTALVIGVFALLMLGVSGAITALGDALFPVSSSSQAVIESLDPTKHFLVRMRVIHPLLAVSVGLYLLLICGVVSKMRPDPAVKKYSQWVGSIFILQLLLGLLNVQLKAPIPMQLLHLAVADIQWILLVCLCGAALAEGVPRLEPMAEDGLYGEPVGGWALVKQYLLLTKPRVISLLLFTTLTAMFIAQGGWPGFWLFTFVAIGGYMSAGAANSINMVLERDLDSRMKRTSKRPTVTQNVSSNNALRFGFALALASFAILWAGANLLTAMLALAGLVFYVVIYTLLLKRRTWQNIVIGGAAGSFPPLVGWAAVTGDLSPLAWILFGIVFVWTPVHFWALALLIKDDYARAGVPMLPVVRGDRATVIQIGMYALLTVVVTMLPLLDAGAGTIYLWSAVILNLLLLLRCYQLLQHTDRPHAISLYKYSMLYLALLFLILAVDRAGNPAIVPADTLRASTAVGYGPFGPRDGLRAARKTVNATTSDLSGMGACVSAFVLFAEEGSVGSNL